MAKMKRIVNFTEIVLKILRFYDIIIWINIAEG